jgi:hypothetical protein
LTSDGLPMERRGSPGCSFSDRIASATSDATSRVLAQPSGSRSVRENTSFGTPVSRLASSYAPDAEVAAIAS